MTLGAATLRSHAATRPLPPARTAPSTAAIVGEWASIRRSSTSTIGRESGGVFGSDRSLRSAPEQKAGPSCRSTITRAAVLVDGKELLVDTPEEGFLP